MSDLVLVLIVMFIAFAAWVVADGLCNITSETERVECSFDCYPRMGG